MTSAITRRGAAVAAALTALCLLLIGYLIFTTARMDPCERRAAQAHRVNGKVECITDDERIVTP